MDNSTNSVPSSSVDAAISSRGLPIPPKPLGKCVEFEGGTIRGYGIVILNNRFHYAHRLAWEAVNGPIPPGMQIDHLCRNPACVNVNHLEAVTKRVNVLRGISPAAVNARKTKCKNGHPLEANNLCKRPDAARVCRTCYNARAKRDRDRVRARNLGQGLDWCRQRGKLVLSVAPMKGANMSEQNVSIPAAEIARLRGAAEDVPILEAQVKGLLTNVANLDATLAELRAQHAQDQADREHYMGKLGEALAENARLRAELATLTLPQPVADWRERCEVQLARDGLWDIHSPCGMFWLAGEWYRYEPGTYPRGYHGVYDDEASARAALAACPTPPPGVGK
jgi:hypothetical protein